MRGWAILLSGLVVWSEHFFFLYAVASTLPGVPWTRIVVIAATLVAVVTNLLIFRTVRVLSSDDPVDRWIAQGARLGALLSLIAVLWQAMPAIVAG